MDIRPGEEPEQVLRVHATIVSVVEDLLGPRDTSWLVDPPAFVDGGPRLWLVPLERRVHIQLSPNAEVYMPTVVFELAHEAVHLLNPVLGYTNYLEEGVATCMQLRLAPALSGIDQPVAIAGYLEAKSLVDALDTDPIVAARRIRDEVGSLGAATRSDIDRLFPTVDPHIRSRLAAECRPR